MLQMTQIHIPEASVVAVKTKVNQDLTEDMDKGEEEVRKGDFDSFLALILQMQFQIWFKTHRFIFSVDLPMKFIVVVLSPHPRIQSDAIIWIFKIHILTYWWCFCYCFFFCITESTFIAGSYQKREL